MYGPSRSRSHPTSRSSRAYIGGPPATLALSVTFRIVGWGVLLGILTGGLAGTALGFFASSAPGGSGLPFFGLYVGVVYGFLAGFLFSLVAGIVSAAFVPAVLSGGRSASSASTAATVSVGFLLFLGLFMFDPFIPLLVVIVFIVVPATWWACNRTLSSILPVPSRSPRAFGPLRSGVPYSQVTRGVPSSSLRRSSVPNRVRRVPVRE